jgi:hypothetical protein
MGDVRDIAGRGRHLRAMGMGGKLRFQFPEMYPETGVVAIGRKRPWLETRELRARSSP